MNASAVLEAHGWRGRGHTLHATDDSTGLARPLLLPRKDNKLGLGKKPHATADQWWLMAFDQQLQGLDTSKKGLVVQTVTHGTLNAVAAGGGGKYQGAAGLYASFVRGGMLDGTITPKESMASEEEKQVKETTEQRRARREAKRLKKKEKAAARQAEARDEGTESPPETKEERRARKEAKRKRRKAEGREKDDG